MQRLQTADRFLGRLVCTALQPWRWLRRVGRPSEDRPVQRVLMIKFWGIGSLQLLTPAVTTLRRRHPEARLILLTLKENEEFVRGLGVFDEVRSLDVASSSWFEVARRITGLLRSLRADAIDRIYDFEFFTRFSAVVSFAVGAQRTHGFSSTSAWRGGLHTDDVTFNRYWHVARNFRALAGGENGKDVAPSDLSAFSTSVASHETLAAKLEASGLPPGSEFVVLNPNAGSLSLERRWPRANFAELAGRLGRSWSGAVVLIGSESEREYTSGVLNASHDLDPNRLVNLSGELSMGELCALLESARAVVTNDSGPMHLAAALGTATLGLFGPETPLMYEPLGEAADALYKPTVCSPCINVHQGKVASCIHERPECLVNISVDEVWAWLEAEFDERSRRLRIANRSLGILDA